MRWPHIMHKGVEESLSKLAQYRAKRSGSEDSVADERRNLNQER